MKPQILFTMNNYVFVSICLVQIVKINGYLLSFYFLFFSFFKKKSYLLPCLGFEKKLAYFTFKLIFAPKVGLITPKVSF